MKSYRDKNDPDAMGKDLVPFRLFLLKRLMQQIGTIPWDNTEGDRVQIGGDTERRGSRVQRGVSLFGGDEFDGKVPLVSILETFGNQYVVGPSGLESLARENISSRLLDSLDIGPPDSTGGPTEWKLVIQGWVDDQKNTTHPLDPLYELLASVQQTLEGVRESKFWYFHDGRRHILTAKQVNSPGDNLLNNFVYRCGQPDQKILLGPDFVSEKVDPDPSTQQMEREAEEDQRKEFYESLSLNLWEPSSILGTGGENPMVDSIEFGRGVVRPDDEPSHRAGFVLEVVLTLVEDFSKPFVEDI